MDMFIFFFVCSQQIEALRIAQVQADHEPQDCDTNNPDCYEEVSYIIKDKETNAFSYHLNGEPKSGTTWLEFVADGLMKHHFIGCKSTASNCKFSAKNRIAQLSDGKLSESLTGDAGKHTIPVDVGKNHGMGFDFGSAPTLTADQIKEKATKKVQQSPNEAYLAIVRDPRDVLVSSCYHMRQTHDCSGFAKGKYMNLVDWIKLRYELFSAMAKVSNGRNAHVVFFESLKKDFSSEARRIAEFLQLQISNEDIDAVKFETSLSQMKIKDQQGKVPRGRAPQKVRKGEACAFRVDLKEELVNEITAYMKQTLPSELYAHWQC